jgi:hypothetical protein
MASNPPSTCCTVGVKHEYVPLTFTFELKEEEEDNNE